MSNKEERAFLHDIMNQLMIADGNTSRILRVHSQNKDIPVELMESLTKVQTAIKSIIKSSKERREILHKANEAESGATEIDPAILVIKDTK